MPLTPETLVERGSQAAGIRRLTSPEPAAIAVYRLEGLPALEVAQNHLRHRRPEPVSQLPLNTIVFGYWQHDADRAPGFAPNLADTTQGAPGGEEVVFCRLQEDVAELHTHGGAAIAASLTATFQAAGLAVTDLAAAESSALPSPALLSPASNGPTFSAPAPILDEAGIKDFLEPAWLTAWNRCPELAWREIVAQLAGLDLPLLVGPPLGVNRLPGIESREGAVESVLVALHGLAYQALGQSQASRVGRLLLDQLRGSLLLGLWQIAGLWRTDPAVAIGRIDQWLATWTYGQFLSREIRVLVSGAPNVGKSSLINALVGYQRSLVSATPGTTRDLVGQSTAMGGWQFRLVDSAGLRMTDDSLERQGIERALQAIQEADLVVTVTAVDQDGEETTRDPDPQAAIDSALNTRSRIRVVNKLDLLPEAESSALSQSALRGLATAAWGDAVGDSVLGVSTRTGQGIARLVREICVAALPSEMLVGQVGGGSAPIRMGAEQPTPTPSGVPAPIAFAPELKRWLGDWRQNLLLQRQRADR